MIENPKFTRLTQNKDLRLAARARGLAVTCCGNAIVLSNRFYGFFFMDLVNDDRLDAWIVDRLKIQQTHTMTGMVWRYADAEQCKEMRADTLSEVGERSRELSNTTKSKLADLIFYSRFVQSKFEGIESGTLPIPDELLHPIAEWNWRKWSSCMR